METARKERDHELLLKREERLLKEEDFRKITERHKRKDHLKKLYILEKELESAD